MQGLKHRGGWSDNGVAAAVKAYDAKFPRALCMGDLRRQQMTVGKPESEAATPRPASRGKYRDRVDD